MESNGLLSPALSSTSEGEGEAPKQVNSRPLTTGCNGLLSPALSSTTAGEGEAAKQVSAELRAYVYCEQSADRYRVGRSLRSLKSTGLSATELPVLSARELQEIFGTGEPVLLLQAGAWLVNSENFRLPHPSATGRSLCAVGAARMPAESDAATEQRAASWKELFGKTGGDFSGLATSTFLPSAIYLDVLATRVLAEKGATSLSDVLQLAQAEFRLVHFAPLDVYDDRGLRVLKVITSLQRGGAERVALDLMAELPSLNTRVRLVTLGRAVREAFPAPKSMYDLSAVPREARHAELAKIAVGFGADIVHGHLLSATDVRGVAGAGIPVALTVHNTQPGWPAGLANLTGKHANLLVACSRAVEADLHRAKLAPPVRMVRNGICIADFQPTPERLAVGQEWRKKWGFSEDDFVLVSVANPRPQKRLQLLPAILAALRNRLERAIGVACSVTRQARLVFVGEVLRGNPDAERCRAETETEIEKFGLDPHVRWTGPIANVVGILAAADVLVSTSAHEGLSLAQLEALAMGCSVVASDVGGAVEIARDNPRFHLMPKDVTPEKFADKLIGLARPPATDRNLNQAGPRLSSAAAHSNRNDRLRSGHASAMGAVAVEDSRGPADSAQLENISRHWSALGRGTNARSGLSPDWSRDRMAARYRWLYPRAISAARRNGKSGAGLWLIANNFSIGGAQSSARRLLLGLKSQGVPVRAAVVEEEPAYPTPGRKTLLEHGVPVVAPPLDPTGQHEAAIEQLLAAIDADPPQSVLFWNLRPAFKVALADALLDTPVFDVSPGEMFYDSFEKYFQKPNWRFGCRTPREYGALLAGVIVKYHAEEARAAEYFGAAVHVVPNGVPLLTATGHTERNGNGAEKSVVVFGTAARINPQKRLEDLLEAFHLADDRLPPYVLKIAGGIERGCDEYAARLRTGCNGLPVEWLGEVMDVPAFHHELDTFTMISEPAGCPNASLEAIAAGVPVIATDFGGASEQVIDGKTGRLVPARNPEALAEALLELATQPDLRHKMGLAGNQLIREHFSLGRMIANYRRICLPRA